VKLRESTGSSDRGSDAVLAGVRQTADNRSLPVADREGVLMSEEAFGQVGIGGSHGFADPRARLLFGYR
jgi:hypothetical protein